MAWHVFTWVLTGGLLLSRADQNRPYRNTTYKTKLSMLQAGIKVSLQ